MNGFLPSTTWEWLSPEQSGIRLLGVVAVFARYLYTLSDFFINVLGSSMMTTTGTGLCSMCPSTA